MGQGVCECLWSVFIHITVCLPLYFLFRAPPFVSCSVVGTVFAAAGLVMVISVMVVMIVRV